VGGAVEGQYAVKMLWQFCAFSSAKKKSAADDVGSESRRLRKSAPKVALRKSAPVGADGRVETCVAGGKPCGARELALVGPPSPRSAFFAGMLLPQPNPIVPGMTEEMHCVTWG
jgi:hypothetical protein